MMVLVILVIAMLPIAVFADDGQGKGTGFDQYGYNANAGLFNGNADGVDRVLDGKVWGDPTYANDKLVMRWNDEWTRGKTENWSNGPYCAWENNNWNGAVKGGSGEVWHYKIVWIGNGPVPDGAYRIWRQFAVIFSQGTANGHFWDTHANPSGYGAY